MTRALFALAFAALLVTTGVLCQNCRWSECAAQTCP